MKRGHNRRGHNRRKYHWHLLAPGDSVMFDGYDECVGSPPYHAAMKYGARTGAKFSGRKVAGGILVERVA
jgi:hypothetical protein